MKQCSHCGSQLSDQAILCPACGWRCEAPAADQPKSYAQTVLESHIKRQKRQRHWVWLPLVLGLGAGVGGILLLSFGLRYWYYSLWAGTVLLAIGGIALAIIGSMLVLGKANDKLTLLEVCLYSQGGHWDVFPSYWDDRIRACLMEVMEEADGTGPKPLPLPARCAAWCKRHQKALILACCVLAVFGVAVAVEFAVVGNLAAPYEEALAGSSYIHQWSYDPNRYTALLFFEDGTCKDVTYEKSGGHYAVEYEHTYPYTVRFALFSGVPYVVDEKGREEAWLAMDGDGGILALAEWYEKEADYFPGEVPEELGYVLKKPEPATAATTESATAQTEATIPAAEATTPSEKNAQLLSIEKYSQYFLNKYSYFSWNTEYDSFGKTHSFSNERGYEFGQLTQENDLMQLYLTKNALYGEEQRIHYGIYYETQTPWLDMYAIDGTSFGALLEDARPILESWPNALSVEELYARATQDSLCKQDQYGRNYYDYDETVNGVHYDIWYSEDLGSVNITIVFDSTAVISGS